MNVQPISTSLIDPDPDQPRKTMHPEELKRLALSVQRSGQLQPIIIFSVGDRFCVADGHRRLAAIKLLSRETVEAVILPEKPAPDELLIVQMTANCQRSDLLPSELAAAMQRFKDLKGWSNTEIAQNLSMSKAKVTQVLSYLKLPDDVREMVDDGRLAGSTAYAISRETDTDARQRLVREAVNGELKRDEASRRVGRKPTPTRKTRTTFTLPQATVVFNTEAPMTIDDCISVNKTIMAACRKAAREGIDLSTLQQILGDQNATRN